MDPAAAAGQVFGILELFEGILLYCDAFTILASTSVSRHWRDWTLQSKAIKHHMKAIHPPAWLPNTMATTGKDQGHYQLTELDGTPWCFRTTATHGTLWIMRIPKAGIEIFVLISQSPKRPMLRLGHDKSVMYVMSDRQSFLYCRWRSEWHPVGDTSPGPMKSSTD